MLSSQGNVDISGLKHLIQKHPDSGQLYFALGVQYSEQAKWGEARTAFDDALREANLNPEAFRDADSQRLVGQVLTTTSTVCRGWGGDDRSSAARILASSSASSAPLPSRARPTTCSC